MEEKCTIIIFGAAGGIGREFVGRLKNTYNIIAIDCSEAVMELEEEKVQCMVLDMMSSDAGMRIRETLDTVEKVYGVIFSSGIMIPGNVESLSIDDWNYTMDSNLNAIFRMTKVIIPYLLKNKKSHIITIASNLGTVGTYDLCSYSTTKAAVIEFMKCLALDYGDRGVLANCISPGFVKTSMLNSAMKRFATNKKWMFATGGLPRQYVEVNEVTNTVEYLLSQSCLNGTNIVIDHGYSVR